MTRMHINVTWCRLTPAPPDILTGTTQTKLISTGIFLKRFIKCRNLSTTARCAQMLPLLPPRPLPLFFMPKKAQTFSCNKSIDMFEFCCSLLMGNISYYQGCGSGSRREKFSNKNRKNAMKLGKSASLFILKKVNLPKLHCFLLLFLFAAWAYSYIISDASIVSGTQHPAV